MKNGASGSRPGMEASRPKAGTRVGVGPGPLVLIKPAHPVLKESEHRLIGDFIEREFGIRMPSAKKALIEGRLGKRLTACGIASYGEYFEFITRDPRGRDEFLHFTDLVSTHETSFFREDAHFRQLSATVLPNLLSRSGRREIRVLSAACSSGEEAYSLGMWISRDLEHKGRGHSLAIEGFDLSPRMVDVARRGVYTADRVAKIPPDLRLRWLMRSRDPGKDLYRFVPELRGRMAFHTGNLLSDLGLLHESYDIIFCRNVLIYFERANQSLAIDALLSRLSPGGYLFLGHSESLSGSGQAMSRVAMSVFRK